MPGPEWPWAAATSEVDTWVVNAETGALRHLATDTWSIVSWQDPWIYFARSGGPTDWPGDVLFRIPAEGGAEERLLDVPPRCISPSLSARARFLVCDYDESQLDLRVIDDLGSGR